MVVKAINDLNRVDYTDYCRNCKYSTNIGLLEYCCSFVLDLCREYHFENKDINLLKNILPVGNVDYFYNVNFKRLLDNDSLKINVTLNMETILYGECNLILSKIKKELLDTGLFKNISFNNFKIGENAQNTGNPVVDGFYNSYISEKI